MSRVALNRSAQLEQEGRFIEAEIIRKIEAQRGRRSKKNATGEDITAVLLKKIKEAISETLTDYDLSTAIYYIEKATDSPLKSLESALISTIQEVIDSK